MKSILVDIYKTNTPYSGLGQFSINYANELIKNLPQNTLFDFLVPSNYNLEYSKNNIVKANFQKRYFSWLNKNYTIWHSLHQFPSHLPNPKSKLILTIHDLNFLVEKNSNKAELYLKKLQKNIDKAHTITAISEYTKSQIERNLDIKNKKIHVIHNGVLDNTDTFCKKPKFINGQKFFFTIGIFNEKKNFETLLPLMHEFKEFKLVIAGDYDTPYGKIVIEKIQKSNLKDQILTPGKISNSDKSWLYKNCEAFLFPSLAEGFGMPVIEAMREGKPTIISNLTSLPEIGGDKALYFNSFDKNHMVNQIKTALNLYSRNSEKFKQEVIKHSNKFTWSKAMENYVNLYEQLL